MTQILCNYLDKLSEIEKEHGKLGVITGMLSLIVMLILGLTLIALGTWITIYAFTEIVNKIFF